MNEELIVYRIQMSLAALMMALGGGLIVYSVLLVQLIHHFEIYK
jgi:hypothetical protein